MRFQLYLEAPLSNWQGRYQWILLSGYSTSLSAPRTLTSQIPLPDWRHSIPNKWKTHYDWARVQLLSCYKQGTRRNSRRASATWYMARQNLSRTLYLTDSWWLACHTFSRGRWIWPYKQSVGSIPTSSDSLRERSSRTIWSWHTFRWPSICYEAPWSLIDVFNWRSPTGSVGLDFIYCLYVSLPFRSEELDQ